MSYIDMYTHTQRCTGMHPYIPFAMKKKICLESKAKNTIKYAIL